MTIEKKVLKSYLFLLALFFAASRGLFELYTGKAVAFIIQLFGIIVCLLPVFNLSLILNHFKKNRSLGLMAVIIVFSVLSAVATLFNYGYFGSQYFIIILFTFFLICCCYSIVSLESLNYEIVYRGMIFICLVLVFFAICQQLHLPIPDFPGDTADFGLVRPQSITGSFLHYPLILAIICSISFIRLMKKSTPLNTLLFFFFLICLLSTISRSGMVIIFIVTGYYLITKINLRIIIMILVAFLIFGIIAPMFPVESSIILDRIFGATNTQSAGNDGRLEIWKNVFSEIDLSTIFFGRNFGLITNSAPEGISKGVAESSILQQILNIGFIGTVLYYVVWIDIKKMISNKSRIILFACIFQTAFYQSIEVIPFLVFAIMIPVLTRWDASVTS